MQPEPLNTRAVMEYEAKKRNIFLAYLFLIFFGYLGVHRLYLKRDSGWLMLGIFVIGLGSFYFGFMSAVGATLADFSTFFGYLSSGFVALWNGTFTEFLYLLSYRISAGVFCLLAVFIWIVVDLLRLHQFVEDYNSDLLKRLIPANQGQEPSLSSKKVKKSQISG